jgi:hypothetical protein
MMYGQYVNLGGTDDSVYDSIGTPHNLADFWIAELRNGSSRVWEVAQSVDST